MRVLVIGGTGQTGRGVVAGLREAGATVRVGTRHAEVPFDWHDESTHARALHEIDAVYMIAPANDVAPERVMVPFVDRGIAAGVRSFVLLSSSALDEAEQGIGRVHGHLRERAAGWTVLRPSWFMQNFVDPRHPHARSIASHDEIVSATGQGRVGFVDVEDLSRVAVRALYEPTGSAPVLTGPETLSYDDVARLLSERLGRTIRHRSVSAAELATHLEAHGIVAPYSGFLAGLDAAIAGGSEDLVTGEVERLTGRVPRDLKEMLRGTAG